MTVEDGEFDAAFNSLVMRTALEHGIHVYDNLEWTLGTRGNHYLAGLVGLAFAGAYLPSSARTDRWLAIAAVGLDEEVMVQFLDDGGSFEGSTSYHRLAAELAAYGFAALLSVPAARARRVSRLAGSLRKPRSAPMAEPP